MYFQSETAQLKFVCCLAGQIEDVAIDLRKGKKTYGNVFRIKLSVWEQRCDYTRGFAMVSMHEDSTINLW